MALGNWKVTVSVSDVDERSQTGESPGEYVLRLAASKAQAAIAKAGTGQFIVAADTAVVDGEILLGKPKDSAAAVQMLQQLRGHTHKVFTGLALVKVDEAGLEGEPRRMTSNGNHPDRNQLLLDLCVTDVPMWDYSDDDIRSYVQTGDPLDKAGAYAIQHPHFHPVVLPRRGEAVSAAGFVGMSGCYASVMGLPLCHLIRLFRKIGVDPDGGLPAKCQAHLDYQCPVTSAILQGRQVG